MAGTGKGRGDERRSRWAARSPLSAFTYRRRLVVRRKRGRPGPLAPVGPTSIPACPPAGSSEGREGQAGDPSGLYLSAGRNAPAPSFGRALLAAALLDGLLRFLLLLLLRFIGTLTHDPPGGLLESSPSDNEATGPASRILFALAPTSRAHAARREIAGLRPGFWPQGQFRHPTLHLATLCVVCYGLTSSSGPWASLSHSDRRVFRGGRYVERRSPRSRVGLWRPRRPQLPGQALPGSVTVAGQAGSALWRLFPQVRREWWPTRPSQSCTRRVIRVPGEAWVPRVATQLVPEPRHRLGRPRSDLPPVSGSSANGPLTRMSTAYF